MFKKNIGILNLIFIIIILFSWISAFYIHGVIGAAMWFLLKLVFPIIGLIGVMVFTVIAIVFAIRKKQIRKYLLSIVMCLVLLFPILITMNVVPVAYPIDIKKTGPTLTVVSPFKEDSIVGFGGDTIKNNMPHAMWASERWAYDIVMNPYNDGSSKLSDYGIWDKEVYSPVAGTIVAAYDKEDDIKPNTEDFKSMEGNHVYIKVKKTGTFILLNHLKKNSVKVKVGQEVKVSDFLGKVGNSGSTSEPHLHIHHQRQNPVEIIYPLFAEGLPLYFEDNNQSTMLVKGDTLRAK
ncbi:M23 family peptidase [Listeria monocytogenes]|uniref:M23 family metallopeptidase n=1 Tax=Listeria monocytogenes TaxID=1639 RepID=UPI0002548A56|nr:M23 family metallopeptidase [Listeria monocytogenes]EHY61409.1 peptidase family M23 protein [Listeria monocytogenes FSL J1-208]RFQ28432.1 M23 family peptidase [Listeria monocytogenes]UIJ56438.1 M23 family metallopeptidase [Listeria monocytogenes]WIH38210.1 M23 family metallopeptidase [Listeria monocytogenes]